MQILSIFMLAWMFGVGLVVGSFLNCLMYRLKIEQSFLTGRSYCPNCKHNLSWYDLVPVFSFAVLGGKCRYCFKPISWQYPLVELATAVLFVAAGLRLVPGAVYDFPSASQILTLFYYWAVMAVLVIVFVYDLKWYLIPDEAVFTGLALSVLFYFGRFLYELRLAGIYDWSLLTNHFLSAVLSLAFFLSIFLVSRGRWMGFGDVKFSVFMGLALGFPAILAGLFFAFFLGAIIGLGLILFKRKEVSSEIPFGPFLATGTVIALLFGERIIYWYLAVNFNLF